jgi:RNA polymerase sigma-70 factor (ECF subfamily)
MRDTDLRAWLFTIMRNRFLAGAAQSKRSAVALAAMTYYQPTPVTRPHEGCLLLRDLERMLRRLPAKQRIAVRLVGIEGKSYEDAASCMRISVPALRCHLARGRARLRTLLDGAADAPPHRDAGPAAYGAGQAAPHPALRTGMTVAVCSGIQRSPAGLTTSSAE